MNILIRKFGKGKAFLIAWGALSAIITIISIFAFNSFRHITYNDVRFRLQEYSRNRVVFADNQGNEIVAERSSSEVVRRQDTTISIDDRTFSHHYQIASPFPARTVRQADRIIAHVFVFSNGEVVTAGWDDHRSNSHAPPAMTESQRNSSEWQFYISMTERNRFIHHTASSLYFGIPLIAILAIAFCVFSIVNPEYIWEFQKERFKWRIKDPQPTDDALSHNRILGYLGIIIVFVVVIIVLR